MHLNEPRVFPDGGPGQPRLIRQARLVRADCTVPDQSPIFEGHFPGYPLLPGVLMIETMAQTGGWLVLATLRFARMAFLAQVKKAKIRAFVVPGQPGGGGRLVQDGSGYAWSSTAAIRPTARNGRGRDELWLCRSPTKAAGEMLETARRIACAGACFSC